MMAASIAAAAARFSVLKASKTVANQFLVGTRSGKISTKDRSGYILILDAVPASERRDG
jgi:hypothetical protein